jgi:hypothetical protein
MSAMVFDDKDGRSIDDTRVMPRLWLDCILAQLGLVAIPFKRRNPFIRLSIAFWGYERSLATGSLLPHPTLFFRGSVALVHWKSLVDAGGGFLYS